MIEAVQGGGSRDAQRPAACAWTASDHATALEALALIQRAIALDPSSVGHQVTLGTVLPMSGDTVEAQRVAERARAAARTATEREIVEQLVAATQGTRPN